MDPIVQLNLNELFQSVATYVINVAGSGSFHNLARTLLGSFAVIFLIWNGLKTYWEDGSLGGFLFRSMWRIGIAVFLLETYDSIFYGSLWRGMISDVAFEVGNLQLMNTIYEIMIKVTAISSIGSIFTIGGTLILGLILVAILTVGYGCIMLGLFEVILVAGLFLAVGKLVIPLILFDATANWFWGWLRNYIGALLGIVAIYFFLGAFGEMPIWENIADGVSSIEEIPKAINEILNATIMTVALGIMCIKAGSVGRQILS